MRVATAPPEQTDLLTAGLWTPRFPSAELVGTAAALIPGVSEVAGVTLAEGPRWELVVAPGALQVRTRDWARRERAIEREERQHRIDADQLVARVKVTGSLPGKLIPRRRITSWSARSRNNMTRTLCQLDYAPMFADPSRMLAEVTLTYPDEWLTVAPDGETCYAHLTALVKRYQREWGEEWRGPWKREFQGRGAPHFHLLMTPPHGRSSTGLHFRQWLSQAWAEVVGHPDPEQFRKHAAAGTKVNFAEGLRARDPKRVAIYFTKHGSFKAKEYQNWAPQEWLDSGKSVGRFWGVLGLKPARVAVQVAPEDGVRVGRLLRRWARAQRITRQVMVKRTRGGAVVSAYSEVAGLAGAAVLESRKARYRPSRVRVNRLPMCRGWVSVNDGAEFCSQIARWLALAEEIGVQRGCSAHGATV